MRIRRRHPPVPDSINMPRRWRARLIVLLAVAVLIGAVCRRAKVTPAQGSDHNRYHDRSFRVTYVVDGDTLDIAAPDGDKSVTRIRFWGVDTPEVGRGKPSMHFGPEASAYAKELLTGQEVHLVLATRQTRGKYGRLLAYVFLERGGPMFNEMLLEKGFAYADLRFKHDYYKRFQSIEKRARKAGIGLWADIATDKMPAWKQRFESGTGRSGG